MTFTDLQAVADLSRIRSVSSLESAHVQRADRETGGRTGELPDYERISYVSRGVDTVGDVMSLESVTDLHYSTFYQLTVARYQPLTKRFVELYAYGDRYNFNNQPRGRRLALVGCCVMALSVAGFK